MTMHSSLVDTSRGARRRHVTETNIQPLMPKAARYRRGIGVLAVVAMGVVSIAVLTGRSRVTTEELELGTKVHIPSPFPQPLPRYC